MRQKGVSALAFHTSAIRNRAEGPERRTLPGEACTLMHQYPHARWLREIPVSVHKKDIDPEMPRQEGKQRPAFMRNFLLLFESIQM